MSRVEIRPANRRDCDDLAPRLRDADVREIDASLGITPVGALVASLYASDLAWTVIIDGTVSAMFGVVEDDNDSSVGVPWFMGSPALNTVPRQMLVIGRQYIAAMAVMYDRLQNAVHHEHVESFTWLEHLGFVRERTLGSFGVAKEPFYLYVYV